MKRNPLPTGKFVRVHSIRKNRNGTVDVIMKKNPKKRATKKNSRTLAQWKKMRDRNDARLEKIRKQREARAKKKNSKKRRRATASRTRR